MTVDVDKIAADAADKIMDRIEHRYPKGIVKADILDEVKAALVKAVEQSVQTFPFGYRVAAEQMVCGPAIDNWITFTGCCEAERIS